MLGATLSVMLIEKLHAVELQLFVAVTTTFVVPLLKVEPDPVPTPLPVVAPVNA